MQPLTLLIVVPTLDSFALLPKLLDSLQGQNWPHWQLLFIDGHSGEQHRKWLDQCCANDARCRWVQQNPSEGGIFGAMNKGFELAGSHAWLLFWGSDDWAAAPTVLDELVSALEHSVSQGTTPDLLVSKGRYVQAANGVLSRSTVFQPACMLSTDFYRRALWLGFTPPHQATLFGPGARRRLSRYAPGFRLSGDLDYFLRLSNHPGLRVQCLDLELVHMADSGVSNQQTWRRLLEVARAYRRAFAWCWWFPLLARYIRRLASLFVRR